MKFAKIKGFYFFDDTRFIDDKEPYLLEEYNEEYNDYDDEIDFDYNEVINNCSENSLFKNLKIDDIYSNCSEITTKTKMEEKYNIIFFLHFCLSCYCRTI